MSQQPAPNPALEFYNKWSDKTPYFTRSIVVFLIVEYILSFFIPFEDFLSNIPRYTIMSFEIYRLILSPLVGNSILTLVLTLMSFPSMGSRLEQNMGSASFLSLLCALSITTNVIFSTTCLLLYMVGTTSAMLWECEGFWTILFSLITIECMQAPDAPRRMLFIPVDIPSKYMPLAMYALFSLFGGPQLSYAIAILVGYGQVQGHLDRFRPSSASLEELESADGSLHGISRGKGYILSGSVNGHDAWVPVNTDASWATTGSASGNGRDTVSQDSGNATQPASVPKEMFPGPGHRLNAGSSSVTSGGGGSGGGVGLMGLAAGFAGSTGASGGSGGGGSASGLSRAEIAARRMAALGGSNNA